MKPPLFYPLEYKPKFLLEIPLRIDYHAPNRRISYDGSSGSCPQQRLPQVCLEMEFPDMLEMSSRTPWALEERFYVELP